MHPSRRKKIFLLMVLSGLAVLAGGVWLFSGGPGPGMPGGQASPSAAADDQLVISDNSVASATAIAELDTLARERLILPLSHTGGLLARVAGPKPADLDSGDWEHEVNSTLNALRAQEPLPDGLVDALLAMAGEQPNPVLRHYALQHLAMVHARVPADGQARITDLFTRLASEYDGPLAGTAILMLSDIQRAGAPGLDPAAIDSRALALATSAQARYDVRVSAIHACVDRRIAAFLPEARRMVPDPALPTVVRKAAIHAIGEMGSREDLGLLTSLSGQDAFLSQAVQPALQKLRDRQ